MRLRGLHAYAPVLSLLLFGAAIFVLHRELAQYHYRDVVHQLESFSRLDLLAAFGLTALSYSILTLYDVLGLAYIRRRLEYARAALAAFLSYAMSHNLGFSLLTGGTVRYRLYTGWGLSASDVTRIVLFGGVTFWLGAAFVGGVALCDRPDALAAILRLSPGTAKLLGILLLAAISGYVILCARRGGALRIRGWQFDKPTLPICLAQIALSSVDWVVAASVLFVLLPSTGVSFPAFVGGYILAQMAGLISHVPGGLGVFESVILVLFGPNVSRSSLIGALVIYRGIYYLLPLLIAAVGLATHEAVQRRESLRRTATVLGRWLPAVVPRVLSLGAFFGGAILLVSGATPGVPERLRWLDNALPLSVIETAHFLGSVAGVALLILARGLQRRLDAAYLLTVPLLGIGAVASMVKGLDYEEAAVLGVLFLSMVPCRRHFYRKTALTEQKFSPGWIAAILGVLLGSVWLGFFSYKHVQYTHELWWEFTIYGDAPRFLRATVGGAVVVLLVGLARLLKLAPRSPSAAPDLVRAQALIERTSDTSANLALLGDKSLLFSERGEAFIMYAVEGRSWVALGDPVGPMEERAELLWRFREMSDRHDGWTVFYEVGRESLHLYLDLGLTLMKLGEEARVPLADFSLEGSARRALRQGVNKVEREGCTLEVVPREGVPALLPELRQISDAWLLEKNTREKRFSLGYFDERYLSQFPAVIVRRGSRVVAFANIWSTAGREELSLDLMRYLPEEAPSGVMEYLFAKLMEWGRSQGYRWFNLGMVPFAGLEDRSLAPLWSRLGAFVFRHGEHFYNFQGLRHYKEKFDPHWEPKYLASPGGLSLPVVLTNVATLISGGLKGVLSK